MKNQGLLSTFEIDGVYARAILRHIQERTQGRNAFSAAVDRGQNQGGEAVAFSLTNVCTFPNQTFHGFDCVSLD
jgi:hypothetical protein